MAYIINIIESEEKGLYKIIMNNQSEYVWNFENGEKIEWLSGFENGLWIHDNWFSNNSINNYSQQFIYKIEIYHNFMNKAMINIKKENGEEYRKEINPWNERNAKKWVIDKFSI